MPKFWQGFKAVPSKFRPLSGLLLLLSVAAVRRRRDTLASADLDQRPFSAAPRDGFRCRSAHSTTPPTWKDCTWNLPAITPPAWRPLFWTLWFAPTPDMPLPTGTT